MGLVFGSFHFDCHNKLDNAKLGILMKTIVRVLRHLIPVRFVALFHNRFVIPAFSKTTLPFHDQTQNMLDACGKLPRTFALLAVLSPSSPTFN